MNSLSLIKNNPSTDKNFTKQTLMLPKIKEFKEFINIPHDIQEIKKYINENVIDKNCNKNTSMFTISNTRSQSYLYIIFFLLMTKKSATLKIYEYKDFINFYKEYGLDLNTRMMNTYFKELVNNVSFTTSNSIFSKKHNNYNLDLIQKTMLSEYYFNKEKASEIKKDLQKKYELLESNFDYDFLQSIENHALLHILEYPQIEKLITKCNKNEFKALFSNDVNTGIKYGLENKIIIPTVLHNVLNNMNYEQLINLNSTFFKLVEYKIFDIYELNKDYEKTSYLVSQDCRDFIEFYCNNPKTLQNKTLHNYYHENNYNFKLSLSKEEIALLEKCLKSNYGYWGILKLFANDRSVFDTETSLDIINKFSYCKIENIKHEEESQKESFDKAYRLLSEKFSTISCIIPFLKVKNDESKIIKHYLSKYSKIITFDVFKFNIEKFNKSREKLNLFYSIDNDFLQSEKDMEKLFYVFDELDFETLNFLFNNKSMNLNSIIRKAISTSYSNYSLSSIFKNLKNVLKKYPNILSNIKPDEDSINLSIDKKNSISSQKTALSDSEYEEDYNNTISEQVFVEFAKDYKYSLLHSNDNYNKLTKLLEKSNITVEFVIKNHKTILPILENLYKLLESEKTKNFIDFKLLLDTIISKSTNQKFIEIITHPNFNLNVINFFNYENYSNLLATLKENSNPIENLELLYNKLISPLNIFSDNIFEGVTLENLLCIDNDKLKVLIIICENPTPYPYGNNAQKIINSNLFHHTLFSDKYVWLMKFSQDIFLQFLKINILEFNSIFNDKPKFRLFLAKNAADYFKKFPESDLEKLLKFREEKLSLLFSINALKFWQYYDLDKNPFEDLDEASIKNHLDNKTLDNQDLIKNTHFKPCKSKKFNDFMNSNAITIIKDSLLKNDQVEQYLLKSMICTNEYKLKEFCKFDRQKIKLLSEGGIINSLEYGFSHEFLSSLSLEKIETLSIIFREEHPFTDYVKNQDPSFINIIKDLFKDETLDNELLKLITSSNAVTLYQVSKTSIKDLAYLKYVGLGHRHKKQSLYECKDKLKLILQPEIVQYVRKNPTIMIHQLASKKLIERILWDAENNKKYFSYERKQK
ncbi:MAG TPA: hypothetical protein PKD00_07535 [Burkholderiales bacterium]|nr:hypothetical protein [Burkholderiales bacterium]